VNKKDNIYLAVTGFVTGHSVSGALFEASVDKGDLIMVLPTSKEFIEKQAQLEHQQWQHWTKYFLKNHKDKNKINLWKKEINTPYKQLTEKQKEADREWAKKTFDNLKSIYEEFVNKESKKEDIADKLLIGMFGKPALFLMKYAKTKERR